MATQLKKTVKLSGGDYTSLEACMNANEQNLVTADKYFDVEIDGDWSGGDDTTACTIHNYTVDSTRKITIYAIGDAKHDGTAYKSTAYTRTGVSITIGGGGDYLIIQDFIINCNGNIIGIFQASAFSGFLYKNLVIYGSTSATGSISIYGGSSGNIINCIYFNNGRAIYSGVANTNVYARNCTIYNGTYGILRIVAQNCYAGNCTTECFYSLATGSDYNVSSDNSADDESTHYVDGASSYANYFVSVTGGSEDLHLQDTSANLWSLSGADLSGTFTDDIDGDTRSAWDIGADEYVVAGGTTYYATPSDSISISESLTKSIGSGLSDTISFNDAINRAIQLYASDTQNIADAIAKSIETGFADSISINEALIKTLGVVKTDSVGISESLNKSISLMNIDSIALSDALIRGVEINLSDNIAIGESVSLVMSLFINIADSIGISDSVSKSISINKSDSITILEGIIKSVALSFSDSITISDNLSSLIIIPIALSDSVTITDNLTKNIHIVKSDNINIVESLIRSIFIGLNDSISISDTIGKFLRLAFGDNITISDNVETEIIEITVASYTITFTVKKPNINMDVKKPNIDITVKKPNKDFDVK